MKKRTFILVVIGVIMLAGFVTAKGSYQNIKVYYDKAKLIINGQPSSADLNAIIHNGSVYLPIRAIGENMGGEVTWNSNDRSVNLDFVVSYGDTVVSYSDHAMYQYIAIEKNQIMQALIKSINKSDDAAILIVIERFHTLEDLSDSIGDTTMTELLDKLAFTTEVMRSALDTKDGKDYRLAANLFSVTDKALTEHIKSKLAGLLLSATP